MITKKIMELADAYAMGRLAESQKARDGLLAVAKRIQAELKTLNANNAKLQIERDTKAAEIERLNKELSELQNEVGQMIADALNLLYESATPQKEPTP